MVGGGPNWELLPPPPIPPYVEGGHTSVVKTYALYVQLAQLVGAPTEEIKGCVFDPPRILFHFQMYLYVFACTV